MVGLNILFAALRPDPTNPAIDNCGKNHGMSLKVALKPPSPMLENNLFLVAD